MSDSAASGGCFCGHVRYQISKPPKATAICHCRTCQRTSGAESLGWAVCEIDSVEWTAAKPKFYESSEGVSRSFCEQCGTSLSYQNKENTIDLTLASLDEPEQFPLNFEIWLSHRISWNPANTQVPGYEEFKT